MINTVVARCRTKRLPAKGDRFKDRRIKILPIVEDTVTIKSYLFTTHANM